MDIAIIEDNTGYQKFLLERITEFNKRNKDENIFVDFFIDAHEFGIASLEKYKVIISNVYLPDVRGTQLIESIKEKTTAKLALMSSKTNGWLSESIVKDEKIATILDKKDTDGIIEWLQYIQSKLLMEIYNENTKETIEEVKNTIGNGTTG